MPDGVTDGVGVGVGVGVLESDVDGVIVGVGESSGGTIPLFSEYALSIPFTTALILKI